MSWRSLSLKNSWGHARQYLGYWLASTVAVAVFCLFAVFVRNPTVETGVTIRTASELLAVCQVIVALFAVFFVFYFHAALIRSRSKEIGVLLTLGTRPRQIGWMIWSESLLIGGFALAAGIVTGIAGSLLFLRAMSAILALPQAIPFALPASALTTTAIFFGALFLTEATIIARRVVRRTPRMLVLGARVQQTPPRPSPLLVLVGLSALGLAYFLALGLSAAVLVTMIPILVLTAIGTYLLYSQLLVMALGSLRRRALSGTGLLVVSRLAYRIRDYARMLTVVTLLSAMVMTGMGMVYGALQIVEIDSVRAVPFAVQLATNQGDTLAGNAAQPVALTALGIRAALESHNLRVQSEVDGDLVAGDLVAAGQEGSSAGSGPALSVSVMSLSAFGQLRDAVLQAHPELGQYLPDAAPLAAGQAHLYVPHPLASRPFFADPQVQLRVSATLTPFTIDQVDGQVWNAALDGPGGITLIVADANFADISAVAAPSDRWHVTGFTSPDWKQSGPVVDDLRQQLPADEQGLLSATITQYSGQEQGFSVMLFAGAFISLLFFLAAGSAIYFKLFAQQEEDRRQFHALARVGLRRREARRVLTGEFVLLFFAPVGLALVHSSVAILDLTILVNASYLQAIWSAFGVVALVYAACMAVYFSASRANYARRVQMAQR